MDSTIAECCARAALGELDPRHPVCRWLCDASTTGRTKSSATARSQDPESGRVAVWSCTSGEITEVSLAGAFAPAAHTADSGHTTAHQVRGVSSVLSRCRRNNAIAGSAFRQANRHRNTKGVSCVAEHVGATRAG